MLIGGALANALAFTGSSYLFHRLSKDTIDKERKRHDAAIEALQAAQLEWAHKRQQRIDFINDQLRLECTAETKFTELNDAVREYHEVFGPELPPLPREPVLSDFYTWTDEQHHRELGFIALSMTGIGEFCITLSNYITNRNITTFWLPYRYISILQCLQPEPISFAIPNQLHLSLY